MFYNFSSGNFVEELHTRINELDRKVEELAERIASARNEQDC